MSTCKKNRLAYKKALSGLCILFILLLMLTPLTYVRKNYIQAGSKSSSTAANHSSPIERLGQAYLISEMTGNEILTDIEINYMISRHVRDIKRLLRDVINTFVLPALSIKFLLLCTLIFNKKIQQNIPEMAVSLGGHAPPL